MTGERRDQLRAVFLAAIMALSVVAMGTAGLAGTAVALEDTGEDGITAVPTTIGEESTHDFNVTVESGDDVIGDNLDEVDVDYTSFTNSLDTLAGIDSDDVDVFQDGEELNVDGVTLSNDDQEATISVDDGNEIVEGTTVEVIISGVTNPGPDTGSDETEGVSVDVVDDSGAGDATERVSTDLDLTVEPIQIDVEPEDATADVGEDQDFTVTLTDSENTELESVSVEATADADINGDDVASASDTTGSEGTVTFTLSNDQANDETVTFEEDQSGNSITADFTVEEGQITVDVLDFTGSQVSGTHDVRLEDSDGEEVETLAFSGSTVTFDGLPADTYTVNTTVDGYEDEATIELDTAEPANEETVDLEVGPEITDLTVEEVIVGETESVTATITIADGDTVDYEVTDPDSETNATGSTTSDTFSFVVDFDKVGDYTVTTTSQDDEGLEAEATIEVGYDIQDLEFDPETVAFGDSVTVSGTVVDADGDGVPGVEVELNDPDSVQVTTSETVSTGDFSFTTTLNDAGQFNVSTVDSDLVYGSIVADSVEANLTVEAEGENLEGFAESYDITVLDDGDENLLLKQDGSVVDEGPEDPETADTFGFVTIEGPFEGEVDDDDFDDGHLVRTVVNETADETVAVHVLPGIDAGGDAVITTDGDSLTPVGEDVTVSLQNLEEIGSYNPTETPDNAYDKFTVEDWEQALDDGEIALYDGAEDDQIDSAESPDYIGDDQLAVATPDQLRVDYPEDTEVDDESQDFDVEVTDGQLNDPGAGDLLNATVSISGPMIEEDEILLDDGEEGEAGNTAGFDITPAHAGNITVEVVAFTDEEEPERLEDSDTVFVDGQLFEDVFPSEANVDDVEDVGVTITDTDGDPINTGYTVVFEADAATFNATDTEEDITEPGTTLTIESSGDVLIGDDRGQGDLVTDDFSTVTGEYLAENITFEAAADITLVAGTDPANDGVGVFAEDVIDIGGVEVYDLDSDVDPILTGQDEQHNITVTDDDGEQVTGDLLDTLANSLEASQADDTDNVVIDAGPTAVDTTDNGTVDTIQVTLRAENATEPVDLDVEDDSDRTGSASIDVVQPDITTSLGDAPAYSPIHSLPEFGVYSRQFVQYTWNIDYGDYRFTPDYVYSYTFLCMEGSR